MKQSIRYLHAAAGYPPEETWANAINTGNYNTWLGLTATAVRRHFPELDKTQKGHMKKEETKTECKINKDKGRKRKHKRKATHQREEDA